MVWAKLEDSWDDCEAFNDLSADAVALFFRSQARMGRLLIDGRLTNADLERLDLSRPGSERRRAPWEQLIEELVGRGIFAVEGEAWRDVGWLARNRSRMEVALQRRWDTLRQQIRFAKGNPDRERELEELEDVVKHQLWAARAARKMEVATTGFTSDAQSDSHRPFPSSSRPVPSEVEDEVGDDSFERQESATSADDTPACALHGFAHQRRTREGWVCDLCKRRRMAELIREASTDDNRRRFMKAFNRDYGHIYGRPA